MSKLKKRNSKIIWIILAILVFVLVTPWGRTFYKTLIILPEFIPNSPIKTINLLTPTPQIKEVEFKSQDKTIFADLYLPKTRGKYPAAVLHLGVDIDRKDERIQKLANVSARSGIATLVPNIPSLHNRRVLTETKDDLISSFDYLKSQPNINKKKLGFIGFCASGGLVILAAEDLKINDQVNFIVAVNPYYDLKSLYKNITLRQIEDEGKIISWQPHFKTVEIYNRETINALEREKDKEILNKHLTFIDQALFETGKFGSLSQSELIQLTQEAKFTYESLTNKDQDKVSYYLEKATSDQKKLLEKLSPSTNLDKLKAKIFILMDKNNIYIPYTEAKLLDKALLEKDHLFAETKILPTGDLTQHLPSKDYVGETLKIFRFLYSVLLEIT